MYDNLVDPREPLEVQFERLRAISAVLMRRVESHADRDGAAYAQFERAVVLEDQVRSRTQELERALDLLNESNERLSAANNEVEAARRDLSDAIEAVQEGFALFNEEDVLLLFNRRFCWQMPDVRARLKPGLRFDEYVEIVSQSRALYLPPDTDSGDWVNGRLGRHRQEHMIFNLALKDDRWLQISEHRTANSGTAIVQTDVTDLMRTEREQRERLLDSQSRMIRATLDHLDQGVAIFDAKAQLAGWNSRLKTLTALSPHAFVLGMPFAHMAEHLSQNFHMANREEERRLALWVRGSTPRSPISFELTQTATGRILDTFSQRLPDDGFIVSFTDVTAERRNARDLARANEELEARVAARTEELQAALQQAERSNAAKSRFVAAASHDLLQPLSASKLYLSAAEDGTHPESIRKAAEALTSVETIIEALLDISRLDTEEIRFTPVEVALDEILTPLSHAFAPVAAAKGLDLRIRPSRLRVMSDPSYLHRILQNLISNAIRYTTEGGVLVGARRRGDSVRIDIWDTGIGIREEDRGVIFEEFRRLNRRASAAEGMGLGLAIVERACARLGHRISLRSQPDRGSGFIVTLRGAAQQTQAHAASRRLPELPVANLPPSLLVLIVDDDDGIRNALVALLERWGVSALDAASLAQASALLDEVDIIPDAIIMDYQLGNMENGLDTARALHARYGPCPTCVISANRSPWLRSECATEGWTFIPKPVPARELLGFLAVTGNRSD
ncbi:PAS-domain containing protein [Roseovarius sp.]|uniref:hybrid sensor histidine kinase/response regulator n=1 Tax=Roseovarius sp. TaxID=1486281 RepID=UPI003B5C8FB5